MRQDKIALITGVLGQDGSFMAELLYSKGYEVHGIVRNNADINKIKWISGLIPNIKIYYANITNKSELLHIIKTVRPNEIYNFAGISNVFDAWKDLDLILDINSKVPQYIMQIILEEDRSIKFFQSSSCLIFGRDDSCKQNELTPMNPIHPYGITKLYAHNMLNEFRKTFSLFFCSGIFFNHESERRGNNFFSKKIINEVLNIKNGIKEKIKVGNLSALRDYGYAPDFMEAVYLMMNNEKPTDYVIGTGTTTSMKEFLIKCFEYEGIDYTKHIQIDNDLYRHNDTNILSADITKIENELGWEPKHSVNDIIRIMMNNNSIN